MFSVQRTGLIIAAVAFLSATFFFATYNTPSFEGVSRHLYGASERTERLHLLLPATGPNLDFCRFLLSNTILGYPDPICVGWDGHGHWNGTQSHLFKVSEGLAYLNSLPESQDDELVLMLDAYDIWMLLRPEIIISRYNKIMRDQRRALQKDGLFGKLNRGEPISNTLLFGADKICWPRGPLDPGCWALPDSTMSEKHYGPSTGTSMTMNRPKWLNSGTLLGPAGHMRDMFNATMENIERNWDEEYSSRNSDQYYFSDLWAEQQLTRLQLRDGYVHPPVVGYHENGSERLGEMPEIPDDRRTEYHLSLDYEIDIFQTAAGFTELVTWMSFNHTSPVDPEHSSLRRRLDQLELPEDIAKSRPPFDTPSPREDLPTEKGWRDVILGVEVTLQSVYPLYHLTGNKEYRERWWHYAWFHPYGKQLLAANSQPITSGEPETIAVVDGVRYIAADTKGVANASWAGDRGGIWTDRGVRLNWTTLCGEWEQDPHFFLE